MELELQQSPSASTVHAPYNFIPFPEQVIIPYPGNKGRPRYSDSMTNYLSGQIRITVTTQTPLIITDTCVKTTDENPQRPFVRETDGTPYIPASTLRGLLRSNMTILGFGYAQNGNGFLPQSPYFREVWDPEKDPVNEPPTFARQLYRKKLGIETYNIPGTEKRYSIPTKVTGGYLYCDRNANGFIRPVKDRVYHISRRDPMAAQWSNKYAMYEQVFYQVEGTRVTRLETQNFPGGRPGYIFSPAWKKNQHSLYLFPEADLTAPKISLPVASVLQYQTDYNYRKRNLRGTNADHPSDPEFWALPQDIHKPKPIFYHIDGNYINIGMSRFLRLSCGRSTVDCLPQVHQRESITDYPSAIFGITFRRRSIGSRISISDCHASSEYASMTTSLFLMRPNTAFGITYLKDGKTFTHPDAMLRGYKHYWLKDPVPSTKQCNLRLEAMSAGTSFSGVIRYHHLTPDELGLLLWCITLEDGCYHTIGRGKPYGYGRIGIQIDQLYEYDANQLYSTLTATPSPCKNPTQRIAELIKCYQQKAQTLLGRPDKGLLEYPHIQDFLYMKKVIRTDLEQVDYMRITSGFNEYEHCHMPLPTVQQIREQETAD
jgi:CRISPR-associated protein (TIGR03986 family)